MDALARIATVVGEKGLVSTDDAQDRYLVDERQLFAGRALAIVRPASVDEVAAVVAICAEHEIPIVPQGGNTGYCGGATPDRSGRQLVVSMARMNAIVEVDARSYTLTAEAGAVLADVQAAAHTHGLLFPLSMGSEGTCQIGGNLSTNAGGLAVLKYGTARDLVLGLQVVLPDGRIWNGLRALRKDTTGYDLKQLFIGAEGTLGIITTAVLKLYPRPPLRATAWARIESLAAAVDLLGVARERTVDGVTSFEYVSGASLGFVLSEIENTRSPFADDHDHHVLIECAGGAPQPAAADTLAAVLETATERGWVHDAVIAQSEQQRAELWRLRECIPEAERRLGGSIKHDVAVSIADIAAYVVSAREALGASFPAARLSVYGHIGDGNIHFNVLAPTDLDAETFKQAHADTVSALVHDLAADHAGSFSAEHGVGQLKAKLLERYEDAIALELMTRLKRVIDPKGIMNPGKILAAVEG